MTNETRPATDWLIVALDGSATVDLTAASDEQIREWKIACTLREIKLMCRIASDAEIIKAREAAYDTAQEGLKNARKQESEMRETIRNHESQARDARVYIASLEAERVALRAQVETLRKALKAALGHCDCSDYNGKALIPCTDANPCSGCYTTQTGQAALAATEPKGEAK